jgi:hypothetical protein
VVGVKKHTGFLGGAWTKNQFLSRGGWGVRAPARALLCAQRQDDASIVFLSPTLVCDALHRASSDTERLGHPQNTHALSKLLPHLAFGRAVDLRPAELHALSDGALETCFDSLANHGPLNDRIWENPNRSGRGRCPAEPGSNNARSGAGIGLEIRDAEKMMVAWNNLFAIAARSPASS